MKLVNDTVVINLATDLRTAMDLMEAVSKQYRTRMKEIADYEALATPNETQLALVVHYTDELARLEQFHTDLLVAINWSAPYTLADFWADVDERINS